MSSGKIDANHSHKLGKKSSHTCPSARGACLLLTTHIQSASKFYLFFLQNSPEPNSFSPLLVLLPPQAQVIIMSHHSTTIPCYLVALFSPGSKHLFSTHSLELLFQHVSPSIPLCLKPSKDSSVTRNQVKVLWGLLGPGTLCVTPAIHPTLPYSFGTFPRATLLFGHSATTRLASWLTLP